MFALFTVLLHEFDDLHAFACASKAICAWVFFSVRPTPGLSLSLAPHLVAV